MGKGACHVRPQRSHLVNPLRPIDGNAWAFAIQVEDYTDPAPNQVRNAKVNSTTAWVSGKALLHETNENPRPKAKLRNKRAETVKSNRNFEEHCNDWYNNGSIKLILNNMKF